MSSPNTRDGRAPNRRATVARRSRPDTAADQGTRRRRDGRDGRDGYFTGLTTSPPARRATTQSEQSAGRLLTVGQAAERLGTTERFPRRLIAERRITFVKLGSHVRIPEAALDELIAASTVQAAE